MAKSSTRKVTSPRVATKASAALRSKRTSSTTKTLAALRSKRTSSTTKTLAGSALSQARAKKK